MKPFLSGALLTGLLVSTTALQAREIYFGGYLESVAINEDIAAREGVDDTAVGLGLEVNYIPEDSWFEGTLGFGLIAYDDKQSYSVTVVGTGTFNSGDVSTASSDATGLMGFVEFGPKYALVEDSITAYAKFGVSGLSSDRSIANCSNCPEENINIDGGPYLQLGIGFLFETWELMIKYNSYTGDEGLDNNIRIGFRGRY